MSYSRPCSTSLVSMFGVNHLTCLLSWPRSRSRRHSLALVPCRSCSTQFDAHARSLLCPQGKGTEDEIRLDDTASSSLARNTKAIFIFSTALDLADVASVSVHVRGVYVNTNET